MKLFLPRIDWEGDFDNYFEKSFSALGVDVLRSKARFRLNDFMGHTKLRSIDQIRRAEFSYYLKKYNSAVLEECIAMKPDIVAVFNESNLEPETIRNIKSSCKCLMVLLLGDDPWDSVRWKCDFPHSLKYYDIIFSGDPVWNNNIRKVAPQAKIYWHFVGYDPERFYPIDPKSLSQAEQEILSCDLAFTGSSYGTKAEGAYRSDILSYLCDYDLKIWGGDNWPYRFKFNPALAKCVKGQRLSFNQLRALYSSAKIFLNLPAPQICFGFQPRTFEIAGCKGFQIADNRTLLRYLFNEDELVVFDTIGELRDKIEYYLANESERLRLTENLHQRVVSQYSWSHWARRIMATINSGEGIEDLDMMLRNQSNDELTDVLRNY